MLLHGKLEKDTLLSKFQLPESIFITTGDPNRSRKQRKSECSVDVNKRLSQEGAEGDQITSHYGPKKQTRECERHIEEVQRTENKNVKRARNKNV